jgi:O-antigen ligase
MIYLKFLALPIYRWFDRKGIIVLKTAIILGVLFLGAAIVPRIALGQRITLFLLFAFILAVIVILFMRWPVLGLVSIFLGGMFVPINGPSGLNAAVGAVALMLGLWILKMVVVQRHIDLIVSRVTLPLFLLVVVSILSFGFGQLQWFVNAQPAPVEAQLGGFSIFLLSIGAFLTVAHVVQDQRSLEILTWVFVAFGAVYIFGRAIHLGSIDRIYHLGFSSGSMFWTWLVAISFSQAVFNQQLRPRVRLLLGGVVLATLYVALTQGYDWKSGWLPPLVAMAAMVALKYPRLAFLMIPVLIYPVIDFINQIIRSDDYSWGTRIDAWIIMLNIVKENPILGLGFANYYWITPLFPIRGYAVSFNSHNQYLDIIAQTGLLGLGCILWFFLEAGRLGWNLRIQAPEGFQRAYAYGAFGGLVGMVVASMLVDWVLPFVYNIGLNGFRASVLAWIFLGGLISLTRMTTKVSQQA